MDALNSNESAAAHKIKLS